MRFTVKNTTLIGPFDLLAPHSCMGCGRTGAILCDCCKNNIILRRHNFCPHCKKPNPTGKCPHCQDLPPAFVVSERIGLIDAMIHNFKYQSVRALARPLAEILNETLPPIDGPISIVPLPTTSNHIRERGLDHTYKVAKIFTKLRPNCKVERCLVRAKNSVQVGSDRATRLKQAALAYEVDKKIKINQDTTYILFDDVWTTGASMKAAVKKLQQAGAQKIILALLAVSELEQN